ncbi:hypothetical protein EGW08_020202, partial [Elysia chlorotica]
PGHTAIVCSWCQQDGSKLYTLATPAGVKAFCSEVCFTQCRRASFKKNKICDWCKHVRHTVNFVDLQEGDMQLQFCSEKCLNQYKMDIFCTEARHHLEQIHKLTGEGELADARSRDSKDEILITPELWLSGASTGARDIKTEKPDTCDDITDADDNEENERKLKNYDEEKEPGEVTEKENQGDPMRLSMQGGSVERQKKTPAPHRTYGNRRSANPSPLSPSTSHSSSETPTPSSALPTDMLHLMTGANALGPGNELGALPSHLSAGAKVPAGLPPLPVHPQQLSRLPFFYHSNPGAQSELPHNPLPRNHTSSRTDPAPRQSPHPLQNIPPPGLPQPFPQPTGVPPVTVLVPYPVAVPIPIPIPIPLPISPEKLFAFFEEKSKPSSSNSDQAEQSNSSSKRHRSQSSSSSGSKMREIGKTTLLPPQDFAVAPSTSTTPPCLKRPAQTSLQHLQLQTLSIDLSKQARTSSPLSSQEEETEAMDLRKPSSRSESPPDAHPCENSGRLSSGASTEQRHLPGEGTVTPGDSPAQTKLFPPRIHIVLNEEQPLSTGSEINGTSHAQPATLPPLPDQSTYSSRRSRILDAPSIPRKAARSPSPERRYVRTVPRDMVEAARRRGLRARVRTK